MPKIRKGPFIDFARQEELFRQQEEALHIKMGDRLDLIGQALQDAGFLAPLQPWEKEK